MSAFISYTTYISLTVNISRFCLHSSQHCKYMSLHIRLLCIGFCFDPINNFCSYVLLFSQDRCFICTCSFCFHSICLSFLVSAQNKDSYGSEHVEKWQCSVWFDPMLSWEEHIQCVNHRHTLGSVHFVMIPHCCDLLYTAIVGADILCLSGCVYVFTL